MVSPDLKYPAGADLAWIAADSVGRVGVFMSAGEGPIPKEILSNPYLDPFSIEEFLCELPLTGSAQVARATYEAESFVELGKRGLFVFDWSDVHSPHGMLMKAYEKCVWPSDPIRSSALDSPLKDLSSLVQLTKYNFEEVTWVKPQLFFECPRPE